MTKMDIMNFSEEKFVLVESILRDNPMSRVALMRYLVKFKETVKIDENCPLAESREELREEIREMSDEINDFLAKIDDEDFKRLFYGKTPEREEEF